MLNHNTTIKKEFASGQPGHVKEARYFYFEHPQASNSELAIFCGGHEQCAPDFKISRKRFPFFAILFILSGKGTFSIDNSVYPLSYGSLIAFGPHVPYEFSADPHFPMEQCFLLFSGRQARDLLAT